MAMQVAVQGDRVVGVDTHIVMLPSPGGPIPTPLPCPFDGLLSVDLSPTVMANGKPVATRGSIAVNSPPHIPPGGPFQTPPKNQSEVMMGSATVNAGGKPLVRTGDPSKNCNDPADLPNGSVIATATVMAGG